MNEAEKKVFAALSEEDQEKVAGGETIDGSTLLTKEQCQKLKELFEKKPLLKGKPTEDPDKKPIHRPVLLFYGGPRPGYDHPKMREMFPDQESIVDLNGNNVEN